MSETTYTPEEAPDLCPTCRAAIQETRRIGSRTFALPCWHRQDNVQEPKPQEQFDMEKGKP